MEELTNLLLYKNIKYNYIIIIINLIKRWYITKHNCITIINLLLYIYII